jgi:hypothetical protein
MNKLFWGFFLLLLDFKLSFGTSPLSFGTSVLHLLPDWLGYAFLAAGCSRMERESQLFEKPRPFCAGLAGVGFLVWLGDLLGVSFGTNVFSVLLSLVFLCLRLYVIWMIINAIANVEMHRNYDLSSSYLRKVWMVMAVATVAACLSLWAPVLAAVAALVAGIVCIIFLFAFSSTDKLYRQMLEEHNQSF